MPRARRSGCPRARAAPSACAPVPGHGEGIHPGRRRMKLLIVDDHEVNLRLLRAKLEADGHEVLDAADGVEALEILRREAVDGVVSDILMPRMDGYRLCMEIRARGDLAMLPFILYTSTYNSPGDRELARSLGADAYLAKPAPTQNIVAALRAAATARSGDGTPAAPTISEPAPLMKQYNAVLIRKLEEKGLELERTYEGLLESQARLSGLISSAMDAIVATDQDQRIVLFNESAARMFRCDRQHALGRHLNDFIPARLRGAHDQHLARFAGGQEDARPMGPRDVPALRADGTEFPIEANISRLQTSQGLLLTAFIRDVTDRRRAEDALLASEAGLRRAQDVARMAHALVDAEGLLERSSDSLAGLLGVDTPPAAVSDWLELLHPDDRDATLEASRLSRDTGRRVDFEYRIRRNGGWRTIHHVIEPFPASDGARRMFSTLQDITEQRQASDKIRQLNHVYAVLSAISGLIVRVSDRQDLLEQTCRILIDTGHFSKAWIGLVDEGLEPVRILAWAGAPDAFFTALQLQLSTGLKGLSGALAHVLETQQAVISNDIANDALVIERARLVESGSLSLALLPLVIEGRTVGVLSIHAPVTGFFDEEETKLLLGLAGDISFALDHLHKAHRLSYLGTHDVATGLPNRALATELLTQHLAEAGSDASTCIAVLDLIRFRRVNETLGRQAGDELLVQVAGRLRSLAGSIARLGGDVFLIQMNDCGTAAELAREFEKINHACFGRPFL
ncbi:MAG: PAS domain S-box protein, partial [Myxococcaceae bacterium]